MNRWLLAHPASRGAASTKLGKRHLPLFAGTSLLDQPQAAAVHAAAAQTESCVVLSLCILRGALFAPFVIISLL